MGTNIEWSDETWNPVTGCSKVSPGCAHCYAEAVTARYAGRAGWIEEHRPWTPGNAEHNVRLRPERLDQPLRWRRPRMVFVNSMSDLFHERVPTAFIDHVFAVMAAARQHTFQVLTKRPERMQRYITTTDRPKRVSSWRDDLGESLLWPPGNVWLGVSIENRRYVHRADLLRETPAAVRFISAEPLLGPLVPHARKIGHDEGWNLPHRAELSRDRGLDLTGIDWLIVGGESGPEHRPMRAEWVRDLRDACLAGRDYGPHEIPAGHTGPLPEIGGTAFFFKQWGGRTPKAGGRDLDGCTWDEMPTLAIREEVSRV